MTKIRSSKHTTKFANKQKISTLTQFCQEYSRVAQVYIDYIWNDLKIERNNFSIPKYYDYQKIPANTPLSARAKSSCITQVMAMISAATKKQSKRLWKVRDLLKNGKPIPKALTNSIRNNKPRKPNAENINPELSSKCIDFQKSNAYFDAFLRIKSIGKDYGHIKIPIKYTKRSNHWARQSKMLNSFSILPDQITIRWQLNNKTKQQGVTVGADQGLKDILTLSNGKTTPKQDTHGHTLESITAKLTRKQKGSKAFARAQDHRLNFINWSINQINLSNIKQINLENIININYRRRTSRYMTHWNNTLIRDKLIRYCEEQEVLVVLQPSSYYSQRCSNCGLVRRANRKGKQYTCACGLKIDADLNAARNHAQDLYYLGWDLRKYIKNNRLNTGDGFYWCSNGVFNITGEEFRVSLSKNKDNI